MATIEELISAFNESNKGSEIILEDLPSYNDVQEKGIGAFLRGEAIPKQTDRWLTIGS
jgi:hypothetical protein